MAKVNVSGVRKGDNNFTVHLVLTETQEVDGEPQEIAIGEGFIPIPHGMEMADVKGRLVDAAQQIMDAHKDAQQKRKDIEELEFPEIT